MTADPVVIWRSYTDEVRRAASGRWPQTLADLGISAEHLRDGSKKFLRGGRVKGSYFAINAACATWGGPNYRRSWRATANGMEGAAATFNDCLLALDEISECDPREVGAIVYALGNGRGKQRASRTGSARSVTRWRCFGAAFSDAINRAATTHYGHAGREFLEHLNRDGRDLSALLEAFKALPEFRGDEGQDKRAAGRFAVEALAGELASEYGITGWPEEECFKAAVEGFRAWQRLRGRGNDERRQILERVAGFIEKHGDSRFSSSATESEGPVRDRAGWWRDTQEGREYLFTSEGIREALRGFDFARALDVIELHESCNYLR